MSNALINARVLSRKSRLFDAPILHLFRLGRTDLKFGTCDPLLLSRIEINEAGRTIHPHPFPVLFF